MVACGGSLNCTYSGEPVDANLDVVGVGVLISFFATAIVTVGTIVVAYLSDSLPESQLNELDKCLIAGFRRINISNYIAVISRLWDMIIRTLTRSKRNAKADAEVPREVREKALTRFMLSLSDQQLVTGLAILFGGIANQCTLTGYEFSVILSLAWFSSTTHLATLDVLRDYLISQPVLRNWRVCGMALVLVLLAYALFLTTSSDVLYQAIPIQCYFVSAQGQSKPDGLLYTPAEIGISLLASTSALSLVLYGYIVRISVLYSKVDIQYWIWRWIQGRYRRRQHMPPLSGTEWHQDYTEAYNSYKASSRLSLLRRIQRTSHWRRASLMIQYQYPGSFLSSFSGVAFSFSYGISQIVSYRWLRQPPLAPKTNSMEFGQIVPLLLLVLPIFASSEIYYDFQKRNDTENSHFPITTETSQHGPSVVIAIVSRRNSLTRPQPPLLVAESAHSTASISSQAETEPSLPTFGPAGSSACPATGTDPGSVLTSPHRIQTTSANEFQEDISTIQKYFYRETKYIARRENVVKTQEEMAKLAQIKKKVLNDAQDLLKYEQHLSKRYTFIFFCCEAMISILLGVLFNITGSLTVVSAAMPFFLILMWTPLRRVWRIKENNLAVLGNDRTNGEEAYELEVLESSIREDGETQ